MIHKKVKHFVLLLLGVSAIGLVACDSSSTEEKVEDGQASIERIESIYPQIAAEMRSYNGKRYSDVTMSQLNSTKSRINELLSLTSHVFSVAREDGVTLYGADSLSRVESNGRSWLNDIEKFIREKKIEDQKASQILSLQDKSKVLTDELQSINDNQLRPKLNTFALNLIELGTIQSLSRNNFQGQTIEDLKKFELKVQSVILLASELGEIINKSRTVLADNNKIMVEAHTIRNSPSYEKQKSEGEFKRLDSAFTNIQDSTFESQHDAEELLKIIQAEIRESSGENGPVPASRIRLEKRS